MSNDLHVTMQFSKGAGAFRFVVIKGSARHAARVLEGQAKPARATRWFPAVGHTLRGARLAKRLIKAAYFI